MLQPIGGGRDFRWEGYDDAWVEIDGQRMQSVPGGTHWGGGVTISARDQARIGQLLLDGGVHEGRQLVPREWVRRMQHPARWRRSTACSRGSIATAACSPMPRARAGSCSAPAATRVDRPGPRSGGGGALARRRALGGLRAPRGAGAQELVAVSGGLVRPLSGMHVVLARCCR